MGRRLNQNIFYYVVFAIFVFFIIVPIFYTLFSAFFQGNLTALFQKNTILLLLKSISLAFVVAILATFFGTILGFLLYKTTMKFRNFYKIVLLLPLFISPFVLAVAWKDFLYLFFHSQTRLSYIAVIWVFISIFTPLSMLIIGSALTNIDASIEESGLMLTRFRSVVIRIILPLIKPALLTSFILIFIFSISEFSVPAFFGVQVFTTEIFTQFTAFYNYDLAILQSALLVLISIGLLLGERKYIIDAPFISIATKGTQHKLYKISHTIWYLFPAIWLLISILFPFLLLLIQSALKNQYYKAFMLLLPTFKSSFILAFIGATLLVFIGFIAALYAHSYKGKINYFSTLSLLVFALPSSVYGISLIQFYNRPEFNFIYASYAIVVVGYVGKFSFIIAKLLENGLKQIPKTLDEAAKIEGISFYKRILKIWIPLLSATLFSSFIIGFLFSLGELGITLMVYPPGTELMPIKVFTIMANAPLALTSAMTLIVFLITLLLVLGLYFLFQTIKRFAYGTH